VEERVLAESRRFAVTFGAATMNFPSVARPSSCIQYMVWLALNIADWSISMKRRTAYGRNSERR
jgi:hypothetical protein